MEALTCRNDIPDSKLVRSPFPFLVGKLTLCHFYPVIFVYECNYALKVSYESPVTAQDE
jgi:hypothetical protein